MRWRVVCGLSETIATCRAGESVHERRLADVRSPGDGDEPGLHVGRSQLSGSRSDADAIPIDPSERR